MKRYTGPQPWTGSLGRSKRRKADMTFGTRNWAKGHVSPAPSRRFLINIQGQTNLKFS
jgi:hypothetical protein